MKGEQICSYKVDKLHSNYTVYAYYIHLTQGKQNYLKRIMVYKVKVKINYFYNLVHDTTLSCSTAVGYPRFSQHDK